MAEETEKKVEVEEEIPISKSRLVPESKILSEEDKNALFEKYNITKHQLPRISGGDPVIKKLGAKPGDLIMFKRKNPVAGLSIYYRVVVGGA